jgi:hypothetical protein
VELTTISNGPITATVDQLAAPAGQLTRPGNREADHHAAPSGRLAELTGQANDATMSPAPETRCSSGPPVPPSPRMPRPACGIASIENAA